MARHTALAVTATPGMIHHFATKVSPTIEGEEFTLPVNRPHFDGFADPAHFTLPVNRAHFNVPEDDY